MVFSTFILWYVESKFTLLTYLMENNRVITRASDRVQQKWEILLIFKGNYATRKVYYAANDAIFLKLI